MARPKEFDSDQALDKAMEPFWRQGYEATSIKDLVRHMGINRGSLYNTFGHKHRLFLACMDRYCDNMATMRARPMVFTERPMKEYIYVGPNGTKTAAHLRTWLMRSLDFVAGLPTSQPRKKRRPAARKVGP
jgi:AcrR family transcriptional regulator